MAKKSNKVISNKDLEEDIEEMLHMMKEINKDIVIGDEEVAFPEEIYKHILSVHNPIAGHNGVERTVQKLNSLGIKFKHRRQWIDKFIKLCSTCQKTAHNTFPVGTMPFTPPPAG